MPKKFTITFEETPENRKLVDDYFYLEYYIKSFNFDWNTYHKKDLVKLMLDSTYVNGVIEIEYNIFCDKYYFYPDKGLYKDGYEYLYYSIGTANYWLEPSQFKEIQEYKDIILSKLNKVELKKVREIITYTLKFKIANDYDLIYILFLNKHLIRMYKNIILKRKFGNKK